MMWLARRWRYPRVLVAFFLAELAMTVPALVLFALADPDAYRTRLREDGFRNGFNSSPKTALFQAANYEPVHIPLVWSSFVTGFNVVVSVLSMFVLLVKGIMFIMTVWYPLFSFLAHAGIAALWAYSVYAQASPDTLDPARLQPGAPWYLTRSCGVAFFPSNVSNCRQAKACFAIAVVMLAIFVANTVFAAASVWPTAAERAEHRRRKQEEKDDDDDDDADYYNDAALYADAEPEFDPDIGAVPAKADDRSSDEASIEMDQIRVQGVKPQFAGLAPPPPPPQKDAVVATATTPRTTAFNRLGGRG